jgi:Leucine-rich repeat (LRR) protein
MLAVAAACLHAPSSTAAIPDSERQALIAIYESTHGGTWGLNTNWCTTSPCPLESPTFAPPGSECYTGNPGDGWYGIQCNHEKTHVTLVNLSANHLTGSLPPIAALTALEDFEVGNDELAGTLPDLSALTSLRTFAAPANHFSGPIPGLDGLAALEVFLVGDNQLTGSIPSLDGLDALRAFDARANRLTGLIPELQGHAALVNFVVTGNALSGPIPDLSGLDALRYFYANRNRLTGSIPPLAGLGALRQFIVSENLLTGPIPALPSNVNQVDFGNNRLTGPVPGAPAALWSSQSNLCPNPLDLEPSGNDAGWNVATGHTPWWADPAAGVRCDDLLRSGFDAH